MPRTHITGDGEPSPKGPRGRPQVRRVFGDPRLHTAGEALALAFGPDGVLWSVEEPGILRRWDVATGKQLGWTFLTDLATLWCFAPHARLVASAGDELYLWDTASGSLLTSLPQHSWVTALAFEANGRFIATGHDDGFTRLWDLTAHRLIRELPGHGLAVSALDVSRDGTRLASAGEDRVICLWDIPTGRLLGKLRGHPDRIQALAWHPDGRRLVSAGWDTTARLWDTDRLEPIVLLNAHAGQVTALAVSSDGCLIACADSSSDVWVWDANTAEVIDTLKEHQDEVYCLAFSPDSRLLASAGVDRRIHLLDPRCHCLLSDSDGTFFPCTGLALTRDGDQLASTSGGTGVLVWDTASGQQLLESLEPGYARVLAASPNGRWLAGGADNLIHLWDTATGHRHATFEGQASRVTALAFSPDSKTLVAGSESDGAVWLWDVAQASPSLIIPEAADNCVVQALTFHPDGRLLAVGGIDWLSTGGSDGALCLWDGVERERVGTFEAGTTCLAFHPAGCWLAASTLHDSISVWHVDDRERVSELIGHEQPVRCLSYSPNGLWLASGGDDRIVRLWNARTNRPLAALELDTEPRALCFSPDSRYLYTANGNTTAYQLSVRRLLKCKPMATTPYGPDVRPLGRLPRGPHL